MPALDFTIVVTVEETIDAFTVGLAQHENGEGAYLILQCALTPPTDQDTATGMDTCCLTDELGAVHYGGIQRAELTHTALRLCLDQSAAEELAITDNPQRELALTIPPADTARLATGLHRVLTYAAPTSGPN